METIIETRQGAIKIVRYNNPKKKNAIDISMYIKMKNILNEAAEDDDITVMVLTGTGDFYSSGNDFSAVKDAGQNTHSILKDFVKAFIMFPKLLIAIVNGPAIGVAATTLALCDLVFASENSYFYTPFTKLGIVAEGCSTITFPRLIGERKAAEMLLCNHKMSAKEALECGFVNFLYRPEELQSKVWNKIVEVAELPKHSLLATKRMLRGVIREDLLKANEIEMKALNDIWNLGDNLNGVTSFAVKKSKL